MTIKVVILNWNGMEHLKKFLPAVVAATPENIGIVLADNGSTDGSPEWAATQFPHIEIIRLQHNYGFAGGYNLAIKQLEADYFILLNSDVETTEGWCEPLVEALERNPQLIAVSPKILSYNNKCYFEYAGAAGGFIDILGYPFCRGRILSSIEKDDGQYDSSRYVFWASGACMACRKELFTEVGGFDGDFFAHMEEIDLCWRAQLQGYKIGVEPRSAVYHLGGGTLPDSSPQKIYLNYRNSLATIYKNASCLTVVLVIPIRIFMDMLSSAVYLLRGNFGFFKSVYKAHLDFYKWFCRNKSLDKNNAGKTSDRNRDASINMLGGNTLRAKRRAVRSVAISRPEGVYHGSIILRYFMGRRKFDDILH